jgi:uncharacterized membrane protein YhaH (DUF805 family)
MNQVQESFQNDFLRQATQNFSNFYGRARRREYWMFALWLLAANLVLVVLISLAARLSGTLSVVFWAVFVLLNLALVVPSVCLTVRRLHDIGQSGWLVLLNLIGLGIVVVIMCVLDSQPGENKYGPNPKGQ